MSWAHPEGKAGRHADYARRGAYAVHRVRREATSAEVDEMRKRRFERDKRKLLRDMGMDPL